MTCLDWTVMTGKPFCSVQVFMTASTGYSGPLAASSSAHSCGVSVFWGQKGENNLQRPPNYLRIREAGNRFSGYKILMLTTWRLKFTRCSYCLSKLNHSSGKKVANKFTIYSLIRCIRTYLKGLVWIRTGTVYTPYYYELACRLNKTSNINVQN